MQLLLLLLLSFFVAENFLSTTKRNENESDEDSSLFVHVEKTRTENLLDLYRPKRKKHTRKEKLSQKVSQAFFY